MSTTTTFESLRALGLPSSITLEDLEKINQGKMAEVLSLVVKHVKGRNQVAAHRKRAAEPKPGSNQRTELDKANSRLNAAKLTLAQYQREWDEKMNAQVLLEQDLSRLEREHEHERRVGWHLDSLEQKELVRIKRFQEIARLVEEARYEGLHDIRGLGASGSQSPGLSPPIVLNSQTAALLAVLRAHKMRQNQDPSYNSRARLVGIIQASLGMSNDEATKFAERLAALYKVRSKQLHKQIKEDPEEIQSTISVKEVELQRLSDRSVALLHVCQHLLESTTHFRSSVAPELIASLSKVAETAQGHIDRPQSQVTGPAVPTPLEDDFTREARRILGIRGGLTEDAICQRVEALITERHNTHQFLHSLPVTPLASVQTEDSFTATSSESEERSIALLTRKIAKVKKGMSIGEEVKELLEAREQARRLRLI